VSHPLAGLRVVELATDIAGPYATKLLADAGADVLKIEHPAGGDPLRRWTACGVEVPSGEDGALFRFLNTSKQSLTIDWTTPRGHAELLDLAAGAERREHFVGDGLKIGCHDVSPRFTSPLWGEVRNSRRASASLT